MIVSSRGVILPQSRRGVGMGEALSTRPKRLGLAWARSSFSLCLAGMTVGLILDYGRHQGLPVSLCGDPEVSDWTSVALHFRQMMQAGPMMQFGAAFAAVASAVICCVDSRRAKAAEALASIVAMLAGMLAGSLAAAAFGHLRAPIEAVGIHWLAMTGGMALGHRLPWLFRSFVLDWGQ
jgi:hypothetical protein